MCLPAADRRGRGMRSQAVRRGDREEALVRRAGRQVDVDRLHGGAHCVRGRARRRVVRIEIAWGRAAAADRKQAPRQRGTASRLPARRGSAGRRHGASQSSTSIATTCPFESVANAKIPRRRPARGRRRIASSSRGSRSRSRARSVRLGGSTFGFGLQRTPDVAFGSCTPSIVASGKSCRANATATTGAAKAMRSGGWNGFSSGCGRASACAPPCRGSVTSKTMIDPSLRSTA